MRLTIPLPELEKGVSIQSGPKERILDLKMMAHRKEPISIAPVTNHDHKIIAVVHLTEDAVDRTGKGTEIEIKFRPVWCKTFTLYSSKDKLMALICEFDNGKWWIDAQGYKPCQLTLNGDGTDPKIVYNSHFVLGDMLYDRIMIARSDIIYQASQFIKEHF